MYEGLLVKKLSFSAHRFQAIIVFCLFPRRILNSRCLSASAGASLRMTGIFRAMAEAMALNVSATT